MVKWLWQLKWALVIAIFAGPVLWYMSYQETQRVERVLSSGQEYVAQVIAVQERRGRRGTVSYDLEVAWTDAAGARHTDSLSISVAFAESIIAGNSVNLEQVRLRVLPGEPPPVIVEEAPNHLAGEERVRWLAIAAALAGVVFAPLWFWVEARNKRKQDDDIDATLARMRAGRPQP